MSDGTHPALEALFDEAVRETIERFEDTGSPVVTDGEQHKYRGWYEFAGTTLEQMEGWG